VTTIGALLGVVIVSASSAGAAATDAGSAEITLPGQAVALRSGGSATPFGLVLPAGARCPGDTAHKGYHVFTYLVPAATAPATVRFTSIPLEGLGIFTHGVYVGALNTAEYTGQIVDLPATLSWSRLTPARLFRGSEAGAVWNGGIACVDSHGVVATYWNARVAFRASHTDPGGFTWVVTGADHAPPPGGNGVLELAIVLLVVAAALGVVALGLGRRSAWRRRDGGDVGRSGPQCEVWAVAPPAGDVVR